MGLPARSHISIWLVLLISSINALFDLKNEWMLLVYPLGIVSVILHEFGHAWVGRIKRCSPLEMVISPVGFGSRVRYEKPPEEPSVEKAVAIAGPVTSLGLAAVFYALGFGVGAIAPEKSGIYQLIDWLWKGNLAYAAINLLPAFPLDGGRIVRSWLAPHKGRIEATHTVARFGRFFSLMLIALGIGLPQLRLSTMFLLAIAVFITGEFEYHRLKFMQAKTKAEEQMAKAQGHTPVKSGDQLAVGPAPYERK